MIIKSQEKMEDVQDRGDEDLYAKLVSAYPSEDDSSEVDVLGMFLWNVETELDCKN
jgi:hypothetical protein